MASRRKGSKSPDTFYQVLNAAINDLLEHGFDSQARVEEWVRKLEAAAPSALVSERELQESVREVLLEAYRRTVEGGRLLVQHQGLSQFTLAKIRPQLRDELDRRILGSVDLIRLNRKASIQKSLQRFQGWATSIPIGGTRAADRREVRTEIRKSIAALPFEERRVIIDQGHKLVAAVNDIVARDGDAIAAIWHHRMEDGGYQARPEHVARDKKIFVLRGNWALEKGLMKLAGCQYTDQVDAPSEKPYCGCHYEYVYNLRDLPPEMITSKGEEWLQRARAQIAAAGLSHPRHGAGA